MRWEGYPESVRGKREEGREREKERERERNDSVVSRTIIIK